MFFPGFLAGCLVLALADAYPANNLADLVISSMKTKMNSTTNHIAEFKVISPKPMRWDEADVSSGKFTSVANILRIGDSQMSMATGKLLLTIPFRLETVEASFDVAIIQYFSQWFKYTQTFTADHTGQGSLKIHVANDRGQCKGTFYSVDFKSDGNMTAQAGTPIPNDVSSVKEIADFVTNRLTERYLNSFPEWSKSYIEATTRTALVGLNFC